MPNPEGAVDTLERVLAYSIGGQPLGLWLLAVGIGLLLGWGAQGLRAIVVRRLKTWREADSLARRMIWIAVSRLRWWFFLAVGLAAGLYIVAIPLGQKSLMGVAVVIIAAIQGLLLVGPMTETAVARILDRGKDAELDQAQLATSSGVIRFAVLVIAYAMVLLLALDNLGVDITALITSLGIGGIAVALALQNVLSDLFSALAIILDKPFVVGDFIIVGDKLGTVERVGLKTTRVRALSGEQLVFGNSDLLSSRVQNYKRMQERRVVFTLGVLYESTAEQIREIPGILRKAVEARQNVRFDRAHFKGFGAFSLDYEVVYHVLAADYNIYMDTQQAINLDIVDEFRARGIGFAYPTQTLYHASPAPVPPRP